MSWRVLIVALFVTAGFSAWGGISLGHWLVSHGPETPPIPDALVDSNVPVLDADGLPYVAQPPQPLINGRLGVPDTTQNIAWEIADVSLAHDRKNAPIDIATTTITMDEARYIAQAGGTEFSGLANVGDLLNGNQRNADQAVQPIDMPPPPPAPGTEAPATQGDWQRDLHAELNACKQLGFFDRPSCSWNARNKFCGPNHAWGKTRDCPAKSF